MAKWLIEYRDTAGKRRRKTVNGTHKDKDAELLRMARAGIGISQLIRTFRKGVK